MRGPAVAGLSSLLVRGLGRQFLVLLDFLVLLVVFVTVVAFTHASYPFVKWWAGPAAQDATAAKPGIPNRVR
jgi:hypothetical protein